ncbi:MAG: hypothetical protein IPJ65_19880 [Archangiaceae bacterium]|nr:hypothetical protein [Archangiaceae bacterium]
MDFRSLPQVQGRTLRFDLGEARLHFGATALGTQLMLGALAGEALRLNAHGAAASAVKQRVLAAVAAELAGPPRTAVRVQAPGTLDAGLVAYLPSAATLERALGTIDREAVRALLFPDGRPRLLETVATRSGSSGVVLLPHFAEELSAMPGEAVARVTAGAVEVARQAGARAVSLAGMLPSWTGYGFAVERALGGGAPVTTGHAATVVAMAKTVERLLSAGGSRLAQLDVAVVGFGSIGQAALRLVLDVLGLPRSVTVFERAAQLPRLASVLKGLEERLGEPVRAVAADAGLPAELYACDLVLGASSQGGLVDVERLMPGACVVDDSLPPLADPARAWARMRRAADTVVADGGKLDFGDLERTVHLPGLEGGLPSGLDPFFTVGMPGCRAESLLIAADPSLKASCGLVDPRRALAFWRAAERGGIEAAPLSLAGQPLGPERVEATFAHLRARVPR